MAFKRRYARRRVAKRRQAPGVKALKIVRSLKKIATPETKYNEALHTGGISRIGQMQNLMDFINTGVTFNDRVGSKINPKTLTMNISLRLFGDVARSDSIRLILFRARQDDGEAYHPFGNLGTTRSILTLLPDATQQHMAPYHWFNRKQFSVLHDRKYTLNPTDREYMVFTISKKLTGLTVYEPGSNEIKSGGLYLMAISSTPTSAPIDLSYNYRLTFTDA